MSESPGPPMALEDVQRGNRSLLEGYRSATGLSAACTDRLLDRAVEFSAARMVQTAIELSYDASQLTPQSVILLQIAANILSGPNGAGPALRSPATLPRINDCHSSRSARHPRCRGDPLADVLRRLRAGSGRSRSEPGRGGRRLSRAARISRSTGFASALYQYLYTRPTASHVAPLSDAMARRDLLSALSFANASSGEWEAGWVVRNPDAEGRVTVAKDDLTLWAPSTRIRVRGGEIREGQPCRVWVGKEVRKRVPGFYVAIGDGGGDEDGGGEGDPLIRYYWHLSIAAAIPFMAAATKHLDAAGLPFRLKLPADPDAYRRADAGVLYVRRRYKRHLDGCIARIHEAVAPDLRPETPLFTKPLAEGLAIAEDPAGDLSFGEHRCKLVATALWRCFDRDESGHDDQVASLAAVFAEQNLDPLRPYLGPGSQDDYTPISASAGERSRISTVVHLREAASRTPRGRAIRDTPFDWLTQPPRSAGPSHAARSGIRRDASATG